MIESLCIEASVLIWGVRDDICLGLYLGKVVYVEFICYGIYNKLFIFPSIIYMYNCIYIYTVTKSLYD